MMRKSKLIKFPGYMIHCVDGPYAGKVIRLTGTSTLVFTVKGQTGYYDRGRWNAVPQH